VSADELTGNVTLHLLRHGHAEVLGRLPWSSNATLLAEVKTAPVRLDDAGPGEDTRARGDPRDNDMTLQAVYKPRRGERRLWDFPPGLDRREVAAYELSLALGWCIVPETVLREDLPLGVGSLQRFIPFAPDEHYFTLYEHSANHERLRMICCFDLITNQADRKAGHCLLGDDGRIWAVDNALAFHRDLKLRTVIWDFAGQTVPDQLLDDLCRLVEEGLPPSLEGLLTDEEHAALLKRARRLVETRAFPHDHTGRRYPWPPI
jgi:uncharacterized repeat protein (TIGR03843 family)